MRNIELRAAHHGGRLVWSEDALQISWRHREPLDEILWRAAIEVFIVVIVFGACLIAIDRRPGPVLVAAVAILFLLVAFWDRFSRTNRARTELARAERRRLEAEEGELLLLAGEALEPGVRRAQEALAGLRLRGLGEALDRLALDLRDVMWALEWTGDLAGLRADVADLAREARVSSPLVPPSAVEDARERWRLISSLRRCTPVCAPRADASAPDRIVVR